MALPGAPRVTAYRKIADLKPVYRAANLTYGLSFSDSRAG
jgi:hypothetical protein